MLGLANLADHPMKRSSSKISFPTWMAVILTVLPSFAVLAETLATPEMTNPAGTFSEGVTSEERLSDWLLRKPLTDDLYPLGLQWLVP